MKMKAVVIERPNVSSYREVEIPELKPGFARVHVRTCAICATDLEAFHGGIATNYPLIPGHEWAGRVVAVADKEYENWVGKKVTGSNDVTCNHCEACKKGEWRYCKEFKEVGFKLNGAYADYVDVPERGLVEIPDYIPYEVACLAEPLGVAFGTLFKSHLKEGERLTIYGPGPIGLCVLVTAKSLGAKDIIVIGRGESRLAMAKKLGADHVFSSKDGDPVEYVRSIHEDGSDLVIECSGAAPCYEQAIHSARKGGTITLAGYGKGAIIPIRIDDIHINNLKLVGAGNNWNMHGKAVEFLKDYYKTMELFVSKKLDLSQYQEGLKMVAERKDGFLKAVFEISKD